MKIAVLYIATGRYTVFWNDFFRSCEKRFIKEAEKEYFVFTDAEHIDFEERQNVHLLSQKKLGWPYDTLMRFDMFLRIEEQLKQADYIFFFNSNTKFIQRITSSEILPDEAHDGLVAATFDWRRQDFTYECNPESLAYIPEGSGKYYFRGGVNGGKSRPYLDMIKKLDENISFHSSVRSYKVGANEGGGITLDASEYGVENVKQAVDLFVKMWPAEEG